MRSCLVTLTVTADKAPLVLSAACQQHNESVLWCEEWAIMAAWSWGCSGRVRHLPANFSLRAPPGRRRGPARLPRHIKSPVSSPLHTTFWLLSSPQSVTKAQKYICGHVNEYSRSVPSSGCCTTMFLLLTSPAEERKELRNQTGDDVSRPALPAGFWIEGVRAGALAVVGGAY